MEKKPLTPLTWLLVAVMMIGAFVTGSQLRNIEVTPVTAGSASVQANAMLKFTPECPPVDVEKANLGAKEDRDLVANVVKLLKVYYVEPITPETETAMARGLVRGMLGALSDPDSHFLDPTERKLLEDASAGTYRGIGAVLSLRKETIGKLDMVKLMVVAPMPGSPAEQAGLRAGDVVSYVGKKWVVTHNPLEEPKMEDAARRFRNREIGEAEYRKMLESAGNRAKDGIMLADALDTLTAKITGDTSLLVERPGVAAPIEISKIRMVRTEVPAVTSKTISKGIMYVKVSQFNSRATQEFGSTVDRALRSSSKPKALVLDLRNNPGGVMESARAVAGKITGGGVFAMVQEKESRKDIRTARTKGIGIPVVVLVNGGTSSVAELVAGSLRDSVKAQLIGTKTFGDGLAQTPLTLRDGSMAVITTGKMLTSKGHDFNGKGLSPDKVVEQQQDGRRDAQLSAAEKVLKEKLGKV